MGSFSSGADNVRKPLSRPTLVAHATDIWDSISEVQYTTSISGAQNNVDLGSFGSDAEASEAVLAHVPTLYSSTPNQAPSAPANIATGSVVMKVVSAGSMGTKYFKTFLFTCDNHGVAQGTSTSAAELAAATRAAGMSGGGMFAAGKPATIYDVPSTTTFRFVASEQGNGTAVVGISGTLYGAVRHMWTASTTTAHHLEAGESVVMSKQIQNAPVSNSSIVNAFYYFVLDEDNIILFTDNSFPTGTPLTVENNVFIRLGLAGGAAGAQVLTSYPVQLNPNVVYAGVLSYGGPCESISASQMTQQLHKEFNRVEFNSEIPIEVQLIQAKSAIGVDTEDVTNPPSFVVPANQPTVINYQSETDVGFRFTALAPPLIATGVLSSGATGSGTAKTMDVDTVDPHLHFAPGDFVFADTSSSDTTKVFYGTVDTIHADGLGINFQYENYAAIVNNAALYRGARVFYDYVG